MRARRALVLGVVLALGALAPVAVGGGVAAAEPVGMLVGHSGSPPGVVAQEPPAEVSGPDTATATLSLNGPEGFFCTETVTRNFSQVTQDDFLEETVGLDYLGTVHCNFTLSVIYGAAGVLDRSPRFNGQDFDGSVLGVGTVIDARQASDGASIGSLRVNAHDYNGGRQVEPAIELYLQIVEGTWGACNPVVGLRYLLCEGLNTSLLHVVLGTGPVSSNLTRACRDQRAALNTEQRRLTTTFGTAPASTQIIKLVDAIKTKVVDFKKGLCAFTSSSGLDQFAAAQGLALWDTAVSAAKANQAQGDDRPLYWARLAMEAAIHQWGAVFANPTTFEATLDHAARGMTSADFAGPNKKVFLSGFDPFDFDSSILTGNPSAAAVLKLDGVPDFNGAQIQAVIFPVCYDPFDHQLVENVFTPHVAPGSQRADLINTVSVTRHGTQFSLDYYYGRNRSSTGLDNCGAAGGGTPQMPQVPRMIADGDQFTSTTLPIDIAPVTTPYPSAISTAVTEKVGGVLRPTRPDGPTIGSMAVAGSGGGFLSNEIAYRVTLLRDRIGGATFLPAGHVHTPDLPDATSIPDGTVSAARGRISDEYQEILTRMLAVPQPTPPVSLTADRATYRAGDRPVYTVNGPASKPITWSSTFNGTPAELDADFGNRTDPIGHFTGSYHTWQPSQVGDWVKYARVDGRLAKVRLTVQPGTTPPAPRTAADFNGDNHADVSVWRPGDGTWYVSPSGGGFSSVHFGQIGDLPVEGDFDGDGVTDYAVFRPSDRTWYLQQSRDGFAATVFGLATDIPVPADYTGDGRTDLAVYRPSAGTWYVLRSGSGDSYSVPFGLSTDRAVPADYDGDGKADLAVYRPDGGMWIIQRSSDGQVGYTPFGLAGDRPVPADYDGDGKADRAVFRPAEGTWYVDQSGGGVRVESWGLGTDVAAPADFDGDARADFAVFRPTDGIWYIRRAAGGEEYHGFGLSGDIPIPEVNLSR
jgi:hypothetical protein